MPEAFRVIRDADEVYVFPITTPREPRVDEKHLRLLDPAAGEKLQRLLSDERNWLHGFDNRIWIDPLPTDVGLVFRQGKNEVVLFFPWGQGTFNGVNITGTSLEGVAEKEMQEWKHQYAQPELAMH